MRIPGATSARLDTLAAPVGVGAVSQAMHTSSRSGSTDATVFRVTVGRGPGMPGGPRGLGAGVTGDEIRVG